MIEYNMYVDKRRIIISDFNLGYDWAKKTLEIVTRDIYSKWDENTKIKFIIETDALINFSYFQGFFALLNDFTNLDMNNIYFGNNLDSLTIESYKYALERWNKINVD